MRRVTIKVYHRGFTHIVLTPSPQCTQLNIHIVQGEYNDGGRLRYGYGAAEPGPGRQHIQPTQRRADRGQPI